MSRKEEIQNAYQSVGNHTGFYDGMMTYGNLAGKILCRLVWNMDKGKNLYYREKVLSSIPKDFSGKLLEIPVGTGIMTLPLYKELPKADIVCMDYAAEMMAPAKERAALAGIENIHFQQGDVGALPFPEESFDIVLSMNGFHVFPDKEAAYQEVFRVLKSGGVFCGCFYVEGGVKRADWFAKHIYVPKGLFTPPFETEESLRKRLMESYKEVSVERVETVACFSCVKK